MKIEKLAKAIGVALHKGKPQEYDGCVIKPVRKGCGIISYRSVPVIYVNTEANLLVYVAHQKSVSPEMISLMNKVATVLKVPHTIQRNGMTQDVDIYEKIQPTLIDRFHGVGYEQRGELIGGLSNRYGVIINGWGGIGGSTFKMPNVAFFHLDGKRLLLPDLLTCLTASFFLRTPIWFNDVGGTNSGKDKDYLLQYAQYEMDKPPFLAFGSSVVLKYKGKPVYTFAFDSVELITVDGADRSGLVWLFSVLLGLCGVGNKIIVDTPTHFNVISTDANAPHPLPMTTKKCSFSVR